MIVRMYTMVYHVAYSDKIQSWCLTATRYNDVKFISEGEALNHFTENVTQLFFNYPFFSTWRCEAIKTYLTLGESHSRG